MYDLEGKEGSERNSHSWEHLATWAGGALCALPQAAQVTLVSFSPYKFHPDPEKLSSKPGHFHETYLHCENI